MYEDEAKRRLSDPNGPAQQALRQMKEQYWNEHTLPASVVFTERLREMRKARRLTQAQLAQRMEAKGHAISETALRRIESRKRGLSLDEAFGLIEALDAVPVYMLTPPKDKFIRLSESVATDGEGMRSWFVSGLPDRIAPERRLEPPAEIADSVEREERAQMNLGRMARAAHAFVDALRDGGGGVDKKRTEEALYFLLREVDRQKQQQGEDADAV